MIKNLRLLQLSLVLIGAMLVIGLSASTAQAHVLKQDNGILAELHIPPNDRPQAGQPTKLEFSFDSDLGTFNLQHCRCHVAVEQNQQSLMVGQLQPTPKQATVNAQASVQFPTAGAYDLVLSGSASDGSFSSFKLIYPVHVLSAPKAPASARSGIAIIAATTLVILALMSYTLISRKHHTPKV